MVETMDKEYYIFNKSIVGQIVDNRVYESHRSSAEHFFRMGQGYPITVTILRELEKLGIETIRIIERTAKVINVYECPIKEYIYGKEFSVGGFEEQRCVPLKKMRKVS